MPAELARELVITVPLPEDRGLAGDGRPRVRRFRSLSAALGQRLRAFREWHALTQAEVAGVVGAGHKSAVSQWEAGRSVPDGLRRERLIELLEGRLWPQLRAAVVSEAGMPRRWAEAVRWYRRASRGRGARLGVGAAVAAVLRALRDVDAPAGLRERYRAEAGDWASRLTPDSEAIDLSARASSAVPSSSTRT